MRPDPWTEPPPAWLEATARAIGRARSHHAATCPETLENLAGILTALEVDDLPVPTVEFLSRARVRLTWANPRRCLRLEVAARGVTFTSSHPDGLPLGPGRGQLVDALRHAFRWYRPAPPTPTRRTEP